MTVLWDGANAQNDLPEKRPSKRQRSLNNHKALKSATKLQVPHVSLIKSILIVRQKPLCADTPVYILNMT
jgi:hypothetical protein